jgi:hypothetical protein
MLFPLEWTLTPQVPSATSDVRDIDDIARVNAESNQVANALLVPAGSMKAMGCDFVQAYGLTEMTGGITILQGEDHDPGGPDEKGLCWFRAGDAGYMDDGATRQTRSSRPSCVCRIGRTTAAW